MAAIVTQRLRLLLVDDHTVFRAGLRALLERESDFVVVGEAGTGDEAVTAVAVTLPDVVLMDLLLPGKGGLEATRRIVASGLKARILVLTGLTQEQQLLEALEAGAMGFVEKIAPVEELIRGIRTVARGRLFLGVDAAKFVALQRYLRDEEGKEQRAAGERPLARPGQPPRARP